MKALILVLSFTSLSWATEPTAFSLFKASFERAFQPSEISLQYGKLWHCSASQQAANEHYRYVQFWRPSFIFKEESLGEIINVGPMEINNLYRDGDALEAYEKCPICNSESKYNFRVKVNGDLIVSVSEERSLRTLSRATRRTKPNWKVLSYFVCENPIRHNNPNWDSSDRYWGGTL